MLNNFDKLPVIPDDFPVILNIPRVFGFAAEECSKREERERDRERKCREDERKEGRANNVVFFVAIFYRLEIESGSSHFIALRVFKEGDSKCPRRIRVRIARKKMMMKMQGRALLSCTVAEIPPEGLKGWVPRSLKKMMIDCHTFLPFAARS
ncbi:hypothetical protein TEA_028811 [Camellia sinensis var. sinensis]|uniref:Uncharacterized protein n=1 Tax=Camellia sinensis var. sinensis TaxID=542762 RepID=A0A4S4EMM2_CAMSN|nr:hypothetical protein TEA_028811 [Camellia sinensis var. sinensis]